MSVSAETVAAHADGTTSVIPTPLLSPESMAKKVFTPDPSSVPARSLPPTPPVKGLPNIPGVKPAATVPDIAGGVPTDASTGEEKGISKDDVAVSSTASGKKLKIPQDRRILLVIEESKKRLSEIGALPVTHDQLKDDGILNVGLGPEDTKRKKALCNVQPVLFGEPLSKEATPTCYTNDMVYPSNVIDLVVIVSMNTPQCYDLVRKCMNDYKKKRDGIVAKYGEDADVLFKMAIENHARTTYKQYVRVLLIEEELEVITPGMVQALSEWIDTIKDEMKELERFMTYLKMIKKKALLQLVQTDNTFDSTRTVSKSSKAEWNPDDED